MYKQCKDNFGNIANCVLLKHEDGSSSSIPFDPANTDYQQYLKWLEEGNTPEPADEQGEQA